MRHVGEAVKGHTVMSGGAQIKEKPSQLHLIGIATWGIVEHRSELINSKVRSLCERFEPRSHFVSRRSMIVWVIVVVNRTVVNSACLVPVRRFPSPYRSIQFGDVSEANGRETPRQKQNAHACVAF